MSPIVESDVLHGYAEIGAYMRITKDQAKHRTVAGELPTFKLGRLVCARRSTLDRWMAEQEAKARGQHIAPRQPNEAAA